MTPQQLYSKYPNPSIDREAAIVREILSGNTPSWHFDLIQVGDAEVMPDYLAIGDDDNFCRCPMTPFAAQFIADYYKMQLPTPKLVEAIYSAAAFRLKPITTRWYEGDGHLMRLGSNYIAHNNMINFSLKGRPVGIVAGHKKDVVSDVAMLKTNPHKVVIYGWDEAPGKPIQPELPSKPHGLAHDWTYEDYSHGIRLVRCNDSSLAGPCSLDQAPPEFLKLLKENNCL